MLGKTKDKIIPWLLITTLVLLITTSVYLIYNILLLNNIENNIRIIVVVILVIIAVAFLILTLKFINARKKQSVIILIVVSLLFSSIQYMGGHYINKAFSSVNKINKLEVTYTTSVITMNTSNINTIADLKNKKIGIISDTNSIEGYVISQEIIKQHNIAKGNLIKYDEPLSMLNDLYDENIDAIFISSEYVSMFSPIEHFADIGKETKVITSKSKTMEKKDNTIDTAKIKTTEPFTVLIIGVDTLGAGGYNADSLMVVTFNPTTLNATMMSIPRDTFVPIACFANQKQNKITHSGWNGDACVVKTIQNFIGIDINYYIKTNFTGIVDLVNYLGGIEVDVPYSFCEQNSKRQWGKNTIYVEKGKRILDGEQALALSRNRHNNSSKCGPKWNGTAGSDIERGQNQQLVIKGIANKVKEIRNINKLYGLLDLLEKNLDTNMSTNQILSFYNIGKNILSNSKNQDNILSFQRLYLKTYDMSIYDEGMKRNLSNQIYYKGSLQEVVDAMKVNLGLKKPTIIKDFSFSINEEYQEKIIGNGYYNEAALKLVPDFTKYTKLSATKWGNDNNITINFTTEESSNDKHHEGQIIKQDIPKRKVVSLVNKTKGITLTVIKKVTKPIVSERIDCTLEENKDNTLCIIPDFKDKLISDVIAWESQITAGSILIQKIPTNAETEEDNGKVFFQTESLIGKNIYELSENKRNMTIEYYLYEDIEE